MDTTTAMSDFLTSLGEILTAEIGWAGEIATVVVDTPLFLFGVACSMALISIGIVKRLPNV